MPAGNHPLHPAGGKEYTAWNLVPHMIRRPRQAFRAAPILASGFNKRSVAPGDVGEVALAPDLVDCQHTPVQQLGLSLNTVVLVLSQRFDVRQVELHPEIRVSQTGQELLIQLLLEEFHLRDHGVAPEKSFGRVDVGKGGLLVV